MAVDYRLPANTRRGQPDFRRMKTPGGLRVDAVNIGGIPRQETLGGFCGNPVTKHDET